jgi:hypothetical protein
MLMTILLLLTALISKGQINDSIVYVYFHSSNDTIITVTTNSFYYSEETYYSIEKITTSSKERKHIKETYCCSKNNMNRKLDSISNLGYLKGINISDKCKGEYVLKQYRKKQWKSREKVKYSVTDRRILGGETLRHHKSRIREYLFNSEYSRESQISNIFRPESFVWHSPDGNIRYCLFAYLYAEYDEIRQMPILSREFSEIITSFNTR